VNIVTYSWIKKASREEILEHKEEVLNYLKIKKEFLEKLKEKNKKAYKQSYLTYLLAVAKARRCGVL
jgi:hypothetical protein